MSTVLVQPSRLIACVPPSIGADVVIHTHHDRDNHLPELLCRVGVSSPITCGFRANVVYSFRGENGERVNSNTAQFHHRVPQKNEQCGQVLPTASSNPCYFMPPLCGSARSTLRQTQRYREICIDLPITAPLHVALVARSGKQGG